MTSTPSDRVEAAITKDAQLQLFGINSESQPTPTRFPKTFNPAGLRIWTAVLESDLYLAFKKSNPPASMMWAYCVKAYLKMCAASNVYPFAGRSDFESLTKSFLKSARVVLVDWFKESGIFNVVKVKSVRRTHTFTHKNFSLEVKAELRAISDPTFMAWLVKHPMPGFKKEEGVYRKSLRAHIDVEYTMERGIPYLTYRIFCHTPIRSIDPSLLGKSKLTKYVETQLWDPLIRDHRIEGLGNRLY